MLEPVVTFPDLVHVHFGGPDRVEPQRLGRAGLGEGQGALAPPPTCQRELGDSLILGVQGDDASPQESDGVQRSELPGTVAVTADQSNEVAAGPEHPDPPGARVGDPDRVRAVHGDRARLSERPVGGGVRVALFEGRDLLEAPGRSFPSASHSHGPRLHRVDGHDEGAGQVRDAVFARTGRERGEGE
jgi:hypothetical protein